jgi:putative transposase
VSFRSVGDVSEGRFHYTPGGLCSLGLRLVWCPKYRRRVLGGRVTRGCAERVERIVGEHGWHVVAANDRMPHHAYLSAVGPNYAPTVLVQAFKGRTVRALRHEIPYVRGSAEVLWSSSYVAAAS